MNELFCNYCLNPTCKKSWKSFTEKHSDIKRYAHFDKRISLKTTYVQHYVLNPQKITHHSFYPFIHFKQNRSRYNGSHRKIKERLLYYSSHLDRCVYLRYAFLLNNYYNIWIEKNNISDVAIAYRNNLKKNNINFAQEAFNFIRNQELCFILVGDFTNFFDKLDHNYLKKMLCKILDCSTLPPDYYTIFKNLTRYSYWELESLLKIARINNRKIKFKDINNRPTIISKKEFKNNKNNIQKNKLNTGIPQGSAVSAVLSNIYMIEFDNQIKTYVTNYNGKYLRYSDDFLIIIPITNLQEVKTHQDNILNQIEKHDTKIELQKEKTFSYIFQDESIYGGNNNIKSHLDYLGFIFDGKTIKIRPKAITKYYYRMRRKAKTIGINNWETKKGHRISAKNLYKVYSKGKGTFLDYIKRADNSLHLTDNESQALLKRHKHKIRMAIKHYLPTE